MPSRSTPRLAISASAASGGRGRAGNDIQLLSFGRALVLLCRPRAAECGVRIAYALIAVRCAGIFRLERARLASALIDIPMTIGIGEAKRGIANSAIVGHRTVECTGAKRNEANDHWNNQASHGTSQNHSGHLHLSYRGS